jgi:hypothetical protein
LEKSFQNLLHQQRGIFGRLQANRAYKFLDYFNQLIPPLIGTVL